MSVAASPRRSVEGLPARPLGPAGRSANGPLPVQLHPHVRRASAPSAHAEVILRLLAREGAVGRPAFGRAQ